LRDHSLNIHYATRNPEKIACIKWIDRNSF
jgi:hypothetical protein